MRWFKKKCKRHQYRIRHAGTDIMVWECSKCFATCSRFKSLFYISMREVTWGPISRWFSVR